MEFDPDIYDAIEFGDLDSVKLYWTDEINIDFQDNNGNTMMMLAARYGFNEIIEYLLEFSPNLKLKNKKRKTAIDIAEESGYTSTVKILKEKMQIS